MKPKTPSHTEVSPETDLSAGVISLDARVQKLERLMNRSWVVTAVSFITAIAACFSAFAAVWSNHKDASEYKAQLDSVNYRFEFDSGTLSACPLSSYPYPLAMIHIVPRVEVAGHPTRKRNARGHYYALTPTENKAVGGYHYCYEIEDVVARICENHQFKDSSVIERLDIKYDVKDQEREGSITEDIGSCEVPT